MRVSHFLAVSVVAMPLCCLQSHAQAASPVLGAGKYTISLSSIVPGTASVFDCPFNYKSDALSSEGLTIAGILQYPGAGDAGGLLYLFETDISTSGGTSTLGGEVASMTLPTVPTTGPSLWQGKYTLAFVGLGPWSGTGILPHSGGNGTGTVTLHVTPLDTQSFFAYVTASPTSGGTCSALITGALAN